MLQALGFNFILSEYKSFKWVLNHIKGKLTIKDTVYNIIINKEI